jgi:hypothetical protein
MYEPLPPCPAPALTLDTQKIEAFEYLISQVRRLGRAAFIDYKIAYPKHEFLRYLVDRKQILLHGSNNPDLKVLLPISPTLSVDSNVGLTRDRGAARNNQSVFASAEVILPMFFAILDRVDYEVSTSIWAYRLSDAAGLATIYYSLSINEEVLKSRPFRGGTIYLLPKHKFTPVAEGNGIILEEWISQEPVQVLAKLSISPDDFPFLNAISGHNEIEVASLTESMKTCLGAVEEWNQLPNGYCFKFPAGDEWASRLGELCRQQQKFCPLLDFALTRDSSNAPIYLKATGPDGARQLIGSILGMYK